MARLKGFEKLTNVDEAMSTFLKRLQPKRMPPVEIPVSDGLGRVLAEDAVAKRDLPPFDRSAVDGYALKSADTFEASPFNPKLLKLAMGDRVGRGEAKRVWTGNQLPPGADAAVMLEHTKKTQRKIEVWTPVTPGGNVSKRGEDVSRGEVAVEAGTRLRPHHLGLLASLGMIRIRVAAKPVVALLSTGDELAEPDGKPGRGQVTDVNRLILSRMCLELGAEPMDLGIAGDNLKDIGAKIQVGTEKADVVVTTGGTSVGRIDLVPAAVDRLGTPGVVVHGMAMRPGMPTALAILWGKPILIFSGNPVAAVVGFEVFARPLLIRLLGVEGEPRPVVRARMTVKVPSALGRRVFLRVCAFERGGEFFAEPVRIKGAGNLSTLTRANGYVVIPENLEGLGKGEYVTVHLFDKIGRR